MNVTVFIINLFAFAALLLSFSKDSKKSRKALMAGWVSFKKFFFPLLTVITLIGLITGFVSAEAISRLLGESAGGRGIILAALTGALLHIPALIGFPLTATLMESGASVASAAAFITALTMIGTVTLPLEIKELGKRIALLRNGVSFFGALIIALIMGVML